MNAEIATTFYTEMSLLCHGREWVFYLSHSKFLYDSTIIRFLQVYLNVSSIFFNLLDFLLFTIHGVIINRIQKRDRERES